MDAELQLALGSGVFKKFKLYNYKICTYMRLSILCDLRRIERSVTLEKLDALTQSGFVYTSYAAATTDMGMHVSGYVASC